MELKGEGGLPHVDLNLSHVEVDLTGLADFRTLLQRELDANMRPAIAGINANHSEGVAFGTRIAGEGVQDARNRYHEALEISTQNLAEFMRTSELLIAAIEYVTSTYRDSDLTAAAIAEGITKAAAAQASAAAAAQASAAAHRTNWWPTGRGPLE